MAISAHTISDSAIAAQPGSAIAKRPPAKRVIVAKPDSRETAEAR
jgi:hypothetical protein